jgi:hypothetical protein
MQRQLTGKAQGEPFDEEYFTSELRAFEALKIGDWATAKQVR